MSRDASRDTARARRETAGRTRPSDRTDRPGLGLGYRPETDRALRAAFGTGGIRGPSARASGFDSHEGAFFTRDERFVGYDPRQSARGSGPDLRPGGGDRNPLRREDEVAARRRARAARDEIPEPNKKAFSASPSAETFVRAFEARGDASRVASGSLGWRASSGALPRRAEAIEGVGDETLAPLTDSLRETRDARRWRRETLSALAAQKTSGSSGFEALELRRAFSTRRVGAAKKDARARETRADGETVADAAVRATAPSGITNRGVAGRALADARAEAEADVFSSADGVRDALSVKAKAYADLSLSVANGTLGPSRASVPNETGVVDWDAKRRDATERDDARRVASRATDRTFATSIPPPPGAPRGDDAAARARKRDRLLALRNRGRERAATTTNATDA